MTGIQLAAAAGALLTLGVILGVWYLQPATPALSSALDRLATGPTPTGSPGPAGPVETVGGWITGRLPSGWLTSPAADLAVLGKTTSRFYGEKTVAALMGLVAAPVLCGLAPMVGLSVPIVVSPVLSVVAAVALWFLPDRDIARAARTARVEFNHALTSFVDLVALERRAGSGPRQAMENAARVGAGNWVFDRIADGMARAELSGRLPWDVLSDLGRELGLTQVDDLAEIMRLAELQTVPVYDTLRNHNTALRSQLLTDEQALANATNQSLVLPGVVMGVLLVALFLTPSLLLLLAT